MCNEYSKRRTRRKMTNSSINNKKYYGYNIKYEMN